jgi:hypothetical protein
MKAVDVWWGAAFTALTPLFALHAFRRRALSATPALRRPPPPVNGRESIASRQADCARP